MDEKGLSMRRKMSLPPFATLLVALSSVALVSLGGCRAGAEDENFDVAAYATANRSLPETLLKKSGLEPVYKKLPYVCGAPIRDMLEAESHLKQSIAGLPKQEQDRLLAKFYKDIQDEPPPKPEYVVDRTKVEQVRVAWLGDTKIVVLTHPVTVLKDYSDHQRNHRLPPERLTFRGQYLSGAGPVTIWQDNKFLCFEDTPWMLARNGDYLVVLNMYDNLGAGGPIEMYIALHGLAGDKASDIKGSTHCWLDSAATGTPFRLALQQPDSTSLPEIRATAFAEGNERTCGIISFGPNSSWASIQASPTSAPAD